MGFPYTTSSYQFYDIHTLDSPTSSSRIVGSMFDTLIRKLQAGLSERNLHKIETSFQSFFLGERQSSPSSYTPQPEQTAVLRGTLGLLADRGETDLLERVLDLIRTRCHMPVTLDMHEDIVRRLRSLDRPDFAFAWLMRMQDMAGDLTPSAEMWCSFIRGCSWDRMPQQFFSDPVHCVRLSGCEPNEDVYGALLDALFANQRTLPRPQRVRSVLRRLSKSEPITPYFIENVLDEFSRRNAAKGSVEQEMDASPENKRILSRDDVHVELAKHVLYGSRRDVQLLLHRQLARGFKPNHETLHILAPSLRSVDALQHWEYALGIRASSRTWETMIQNAPTIPVAKVIYHAACKRQRPTANMLLPILRALTSTKWTPASSAAIDEALDLLRDYVDQQPPVQGPSPGVVAFPPNVVNELGLYNTILRALANSPDHLKYLPVAASLLEEIQSRGVRTNNATRTAFIIFAIRCAPTAREALKMYQLMKQSKDRRDMLEETGFRAILAAFVKQFPDAPETFVFCTDILKDMRFSGSSISPEMFTVILRGLARLASRRDSPPSERMENIVLAIRRIHNHISLEASLKPDTALWNQLMDAYQRAGCFQEALGIWKMLFVSSQFDASSISIVWDTCSYAGAFDAARLIFGKLRKRGVVLNERNWSNWLECLCRLGRLDEATKMLCVEMPNRGASPTVAQARMLLHKAQQTNEVALVWGRIERYLPDLHSQLRGR